MIQTELYELRYQEDICFQEKADIFFCEGDKPKSGLARDLGGSRPDGLKREENMDLHFLLMIINHVLIKYMK